MVKVSIASVVSLIAAAGAVNALNLPFFGSTSSNELAARGESKSQTQAHQPDNDDHKKTTTKKVKTTKKTKTTKKHTTTKKPHRPVKGKAFDHFLQVWFENQDFSVINATSGFTNLLKEGILLTNFNAITHPSEPNYVAAAGGDNFGITNDDYYNIPANISSIYDLLEKKGLTWKVYQEDIPAVGFTGFIAGKYVRKHNPAVIFDSVGLNATRVQNVVGADQFVKDIDADTLPNWMFFTPNMWNDAHDTNAAYAGTWLTNFYNTTLRKSNLYEKTLILLTFDENASYPKRNQVWSLLLGDIPNHLRGTTDDTFYSHYSSLSTVEHNWDLGNLGRQDTNKTVSNVFDYLTKKLKYKNVHVPEADIPWANNTISGLLTGKSYNQTHPK